MFGRKRIERNSCSNIIRCVAVIQRNTISFLMTGLYFRDVRQFAVKRTFSRTGTERTAM